MKSIEKRKLALISQIQQLRREFDNLKRPGYRQSSVNVGTGSDRHVHPNQPTASCNSKGK